VGWSTFLPFFGVSGTFRSRLTGQQLSDGLRDLATLILTSEVMAIAGDTGLQLRAPSVYQV